jgi:hypothetical protein
MLSARKAADAEARDVAGAASRRTFRLRLSEGAMPMSAAASTPARRGSMMRASGAGGDGSKPC